MMGLIIKDLKLLKLQKNFMFIMIAMTVMFVVIGYDASFVVSYLTFICSFFIVSTISYDDFNHGNTFLFTLPITRKGYVQEKYVLGLITSLSVWLVSSLGCTIYQMYTVENFVLTEWFLTCLILLSIPLVSLSATLPVQLKYGGDKGRIAMIAVIGGLFIAGFLIIKALQFFFEIDFETLLFSLSNVQLGVGVFVVLTIATFISYLISLKIMKNKQF